MAGPLVDLGPGLSDACCVSGIDEQAPFECAECGSTLAPGSPHGRVYFASTVIDPALAEAEGIAPLKGDTCLSCVLRRAKEGSLGKQVTVASLVKNLGFETVTGLSRADLET